MSSIVRPRPSSSPSSTGRHQEAWREETTINEEEGVRRPQVCITHALGVDASYR